MWPTDVIYRLLYRRRKIEQTSWSASVYYSDDRIVIHSRSRTSNSIGWYNQPIWTCKRHDAAERVGTILRDALDSSTWFSDKDDSETKPRPVLVAAGVKSERALETQFNFISVGTDRHETELRTMRKCRKRGEGRGWIALKDDVMPTIKVSTEATAQELGQQLLDLMTRFEAWATTNT